jgi:CHASE3 domain sensor protein
MFLIYIEQHIVAVLVFVIALILLIISLVLIKKIQESAQALKLHKRDIENHLKKK